MNLPLGFEELSAPAQIAPLKTVSAVPALAAKFQQSMQQDGSPVRAVRYQPARPAQFASFPEALHPALASALAEGGVERLYTHQAEAAELALAGKNVVVVTPTAS